MRVAVAADNDIAVGQKAVVTNCYFGNCKLSFTGAVASALSGFGHAGNAPPKATPSRDAVGAAAEERRRS